MVWNQSSRTCRSENFRHTLGLNDEEYDEEVQNLSLKKLVSQFSYP